MEKVSIQVPVPKAILWEEGLSEEAAGRKMFWLFVLDLFKQRRISTGKAAELIGVSKYEIIQALDRENVPYFDYSPSEMQEELDVIGQWNQENEGE